MFCWVNSIPYSEGSSYHILGSRCFIFSFPEFKVFSLYRPEAPSKSLQGFTLCFQLLFLFYHSFITGVLHGGSTWWFVKDSFHSSIIFSRFLSKLWSAKPYSKLNRVLNTCFVLRSSSILHLAFQSAILSYLIFWDGVMSFLTISLRVSCLISCQEWGS